MSIFYIKEQYMSDLTTLPNIGKVTSLMLKKIGINTAEEFLTRDPYEVFDELIDEVDPTLCRCALASIVGAKQGKKWHTITKQTTKHYENSHPGHKWINC
ncbi:MAG: TfoX/Sxy family DNA transformation protein [bacterium]